jgi:2-dehydro-3-deoxyphosphogluconate aldolase/(4S)-4-hydroxy-2-oxoglutarate aldolase
MSSKADIISRLVDPGIIAVVRAPSADLVRPLSDALVKGGVIAIEVTLSTPDALRAIREVTADMGDRALIGVGTVLTTYECAAALEAGAQFVVSPILRPELARLAHQANRPIMLGAYTPTEAQIAHEAGADFIKLFPADTLGPGFIRSLLAPLPHLWFVPTGGIELSNAADFLKAGAAALGVGSALVSRHILENRDWNELTRLAEAFVQATRPVRLPGSGSR